MIVSATFSASAQVSGLILVFILTICHQNATRAGPLNSTAGNQSYTVVRAAAYPAPNHEQGDDGERGPAAAEYVSQLAEKRLEGGTGKEEGVGEPDPVFPKRNLLEDNGRRRCEHRVLERREPHHNA